MKTDVVIVGGGVAGLCCARRLHRAGIPFVVVEAEQEVGGRVRTDVVNGFLLDHGFQVLLTAYPEARAVLDYRSLRLRSFINGALVRVGKRFHLVADPWREFPHGLRTLAAPIGSLEDKLRIAGLRRRVAAGSLRDLFARTETTTEQALRDFGFSDTMIDRFFRPFYGGILLDRDLSPSSRMFEFVFRMLSAGETTLPEQGIGAIPKQIAASLPADSIRLGTPVESLGPQHVVLGSGERIEARAVVVATEGPAAAELTEGLIPRVPSRTAVCVYYAAPKTPVRSPILLLNGNSTGIVNNVAVVSRVQPGYAPQGYELVSASVVGHPPSETDDWEPRVRAEMLEWFGNAAKKWVHLRTYQIRHAQPGHSLQDGELRPVRVHGLYMCGDHRANPSLNGAMLSGRRAAEAVIEDLSS